MRSAVRTPVDMYAHTVPEGLLKVSKNADSSLRSVLVALMPRKKPCG
jgi:hypothetical protein